MIFVVDSVHYWMANNNVRVRIDYKDFAAAAALLESVDIVVGFDI
jgi:hypothetical protein